MGTSTKNIFDHKRNKTIVLKNKGKLEAAAHVHEHDEGQHDHRQHATEQKVGKQRRNSLSLGKLIQNGEIPIFGYPVICYSPVDQDPQLQKDNFWQLIFKDTLTYKKQNER